MINGIVAVPIMVMTMLMAGQQRVMGHFVLPRSLSVDGLDRDRGDVRGRCRSLRYLVNWLPSGREQMKNYLRGVTIAAVGLAMLSLPILTGPAYAAPDATTLSLPGEGVTFLPIYAAQDAHFFEKEGLAVKTVYLPGVGTTNAVISGAVDFGISNGVSH